MTTIELEYAAVFGKGDGSDWYPWEVTLEGEEEAAYLHAKKYFLDLNECGELQGVIDAAYKEIKEEETQNAIDNEDEYAMQCTGQIEMDPDKINELVEARDPHTLEFFSLTELSDDELEEWDALDLDELPLQCDFEEGFEPYSPFDEGWELIVQFANKYEWDEEEVRATLIELMKAANGDYSDVYAYAERGNEFLDSDCNVDLYDLAAEIAESLGLEDYE